MMPALISKNLNIIPHLCIEKKNMCEIMSYNPSLKASRKTYYTNITNCKLVYRQTCSVTAPDYILS